MNDTYFFDKNGNLNIDRFEVFYTKNNDVNSYNEEEKKALNAYITIAKDSYLKNPNFFKRHPVMGDILKLGMGGTAVAGTFLIGRNILTSGISGFISNFLDFITGKIILSDEDVQGIKNFFDKDVFKQHFFTTQGTLKNGFFIGLVLFGAYLASKGMFKILRLWRKYCRLKKAQIELTNQQLSNQIPSYSSENSKEKIIENKAIETFKNEDKK